jgi:hypothetical protein
MREWRGSMACPRRAEKLIVSHGLGGVEVTSESDGFDQVIRNSHPVVPLFSGVRCLADSLRKL